VIVFVLIVVLCSEWHINLEERSIGVYHHLLIIANTIEQ